MVLRAFLTGAFLFLVSVPATAVETAAHSEYVARCLGVIETAFDEALPEEREGMLPLVALAREKAEALELSEARIMSTVERGRERARRAAAGGTSLRDVLEGCRTVLRTRAR